MPVLWAEADRRRGRHQGADRPDCHRAGLRLGLVTRPQGDLVGRPVGIDIGKTSATCRVWLPQALTFSAMPLAQLGGLVAGADLVVVATPMAALRQMLLELRGCAVPVAWLCKGV